MEEHSEYSLVLRLAVDDGAWQEPLPGCHDISRTEMLNGAVCELLFEVEFKARTRSPRGYVMYHSLQWLITNPDLNEVTFWYPEQIVLDRLARWAGPGWAVVPPVQEYRVRWEIDVPAANPREAARIARQMLDGPGTTATVFEVFPPGALSSVTVDMDKEFIRLCDTCFTAVTSEVAECEDGCSQPLDHEGLCHRDTPPECQWCGQPDRLHLVSRFLVPGRTLPTVGERDEGQWWLNWPGETKGPYPSAQAAWEAWHSGSA